MKNDKLLYRESNIESFQWRVYKMAVIFFFLFIASLLLRHVRSHPYNITISFILILVFFFITSFNEVKRIKAITVLNQNIYIDYFILNKQKRVIIDMENLKMDFDFNASKNHSNFQLKFTSDKTWKLNTDENWELQDLKDIYLKIKEIKNEPLTKDEDKFIKKVDDKINKKGFLSA